MKRYKIDLSEQAANDIDNFVDYIIFAYKAPITAKRHYDGLFKTIKSLSIVAENISISNIANFQQFGYNVRRINYKKMTIIYTIRFDVVYIHRVIAQTLITEL
jgi:hypothetical protein